MCMRVCVCVCVCVCVRVRACTAARDPQEMTLAFKYISGLKVVKLYGLPIVSIVVPSFGVTTFIIGIL